MLINVDKIKFTALSQPIAIGEIVTPFKKSLSFRR